ncbi:MAG: hypothetical protein Q7S57_03160 [bacterium]|nr:hypothetical protein [bacterium]
MASLEPETIALLRRRLEEAERNIQLCRQLLGGTAPGSGSDVSLLVFSSSAKMDAIEVDENFGGKIIHGEFDGEHMKGEDGQLYPVPANYASKSKLVEGDKLKLAIEQDGAFVYKQVGPTDRIRVRGVFDINEQGQYVVKSEDKEYRLLLASVTFYHIDRGDTVTILLPAEGKAVWGAVENVIKAGSKKSDEISDDDDEKDEELDEII